MPSIAADYAFAELIALLGRVSLLIVLLAGTYCAYWRFHPSRRSNSCRPAEPKAKPTTD